MKSTTKALSEYNSLSTRAKLDFDPSGRPGADDIRADQARIIKRRLSVKARLIIRNEHSNRELESMTRRCDTKSQYIERKHNYRFREYMDRCQREAYCERDQREGGGRSLLGISLESDLPKKVGGWFYMDQRTESRDYSRYSKSWHRSHGPSITVCNSVKFAREYNGGSEIKSAVINSFNGDWLAIAAEKTGIASPVKSKIPLKIRLKKIYDAELIDIKRGYKFYSRTLLGTHIDYAIMAPNGTVYHDNDRAKLARGLHLKMRASIQSKIVFSGQKIDWVFCKSLGFCDTGISEFCYLFGFDASSSYTPRQIETQIRKQPELATPFIDELKTLAKYVDINVPEFN